SMLCEETGERSCSSILSWSGLTNSIPYVYRHFSFAFPGVLHKVDCEPWFTIVTFVTFWKLNTAGYEYIFLLPDKHPINVVGN
ncbi:323_t:CDS:1, partial [Entrophospora sp. SA101]